jgi:hypothetical protein
MRRRILKIRDSSDRHKGKVLLDQGRKPLARECEKAGCESAGKQVSG